jgi:two-component system sensor histidine kinase UhpB|tara:strand:+ start:54 stop:1385 length:1332 start_codon:yes stop_codon:yes gene_type:complete
MSLKRRLLIYINTLLVAAILIGLTVIMAVAKKNVREEVLSTEALAVFAIENGIKNNPDFYLFHQDNPAFGLSGLSEIRHLNIAFINLDGLIVDQTKPHLNSTNDPPMWFQSALERLSTPIPPRRIDITQTNNLVGHIHIQPEPIYEYAEIWQQIKIGLWVIFTFVILVNFFVYLLFSYMIEPISSIIKGFDNLEKGNYKTRVSKSGITELNAIGKKFNRMVVVLRQAKEKINKLSQDLISVQEQEKKELARNLHDEHGQVLTAIQAEAASIKSTKNVDSQNKSVESIITLSKNMMLSTRTIIKNLSLGLIEEIGFEGALSDLIENWGNRFNKIQLTYTIDKKTTDLINSQQQAHIYRIIQEALTNIAKHTKAKNVSINIAPFGPENQLRIKVINDGIKISTKKNFGRGAGLLGIEERVRQLNGRCNISINRVFKITIVLGSKH